MAIVDHIIILHTPEQVIKAELPLFMIVMSNSCNSNAEKANLLNEQFANSFTNDNGVLPENKHSGVKIQHAFESVSFTFAAVIKVNNKLKSKSSPGPDNVSASFFNKKAPPRSWHTTKSNML